MKKAKILHYALIPAKAESSRCDNKNWRHFIGDNSLVTYLISIIPFNFFEKIILSTDKRDFEPRERIIVHHRDKSLAAKESPVNDLIIVIINEYKLQKNSYIWLLNPTSPFRVQEDFFKIRKIIEEKSCLSVISVAKLNPFIWKDSQPLFETKYPRKNTQDFTTEYFVENGQFIVFKVSTFLRNKTWYSYDLFQYRQAGIKKLVDIDTEEDFQDAQKLAGDEDAYEKYV